MVNSILTLGGIFKLFKILASSRILLWRSMKFSSPIMCILLTEAKEGSTIILGVVIPLCRSYSKEIEKDMSPIRNGLRDLPS